MVFQKTHFIKTLCLFSACAVLGTFAFASPEIQSHVLPADKEYVLVVQGYDWGPAADKIIINTGKDVMSDEIRKEDFSVDIMMKISMKGKSHGFVKGHRTVTSAYLSDENGTASSKKGKYITLVLQVNPADNMCNPFFSIPVITSFNQAYGLRIQNDALNLSITKRTGIEGALAGQFGTGVAKSNDYEGKEVSISYASWEPRAHAEKTPLIIFLHGISGGGKDPYIPLYDTKTVALITPEIQQYFKNGACVLVPQCPTGWLETTTKDIFGKRLWEPVDIGGTIHRTTRPVYDFLGKYFDSRDDFTDENTKPTAAVSYWTIAVKSLIDDYVAMHPYIDKDRIYIGGCSAGGYMVINMLIQCPGYFAAAFPACEAYLDSKITDEQIKDISKVPLWFTYAKNDPRIAPSTHSIPTIERIKAAGAKDIHVSVFDDVHDLTGTYFMKPIDKDDYNDDNEKVCVPADSTEPKVPYQYNGHYSWIYVLNNSCEDNGVKLFDWLSKQSR